MCLCYKDITDKEYELWALKHKEASVSMTDREEALDAVSELIETNLMVNMLLWVSVSQHFYFQKLPSSWSWSKDVSWFV